MANKYALYDKDNNWIRDVHAKDEQDALAQEPLATQVTLVAEDRD